MMNKEERGGSTMAKHKKQNTMMNNVVKAAETAITLYAVQDVAKQKEFKVGNKLIWTPVVTFGKFVGPAAYFLFGKKTK